jgi:hypothetical protein
MKPVKNPMKGAKSVSKESAVKKSDNKNDRKERLVMSDHVKEALIKYFTDSEGLGWTDKQKTAEFKASLELEIFKYEINIDHCRRTYKEWKLKKEMLYVVGTGMRDLTQEMIESDSMIDISCMLQGLSHTHFDFSVDVFPETM